MIAEWYSIRPQRDRWRSITNGGEKLSKSQATDNKKIYATGFTALIILCIVVIVLFSLSIGSQISVPISAASGVSIFAIFYLMAQFTERVVEPFSNLPWFGGHDKAKDDDQNEARLISLWCLASGIGIVLCYLTVGLFQVVGVSFAMSPIAGHFWDAILSGFIVGGGTKPLHDLINLFDKSSNTKN